jgi:hypothetical protein
MGDAKCIHNTECDIRTLDMFVCRTRVTTMTKMEDETNVNEWDWLEEMTSPLLNKMEG